MPEECGERIRVEDIVQLQRELYELGPFPEVMDQVILAGLAAATAHVRKIFESPDTLSWWEHPSQKRLREQFLEDLEDLEARVAQYENITAFRLGDLQTDPPEDPASWEPEYQGAVVGPVLYGRYTRPVQVEDWQRVDFPDAGTPYRLINQLCAWEFPWRLTGWGDLSPFLYAQLGAMYEGSLYLAREGGVSEEKIEQVEQMIGSINDAMEDAGEFIVDPPLPQLGYGLAAVTAVVGGTLLYGLYRRARGA